MTAFAILLPQAFHLTGIPQSGQIFLPMHIPVLISGFVLGPVFGLFIGVLSPIISSLLTGMPDSFRLPFMIAELASYGFMSGILTIPRSKAQKGRNLYYAYKRDDFRQAYICRFIAFCRRGS